MTELTVVAPAFNEAANLATFIERTLRTLDGLDCVSELIVVDDGSVDDTWSVIEREALRDDRVRGLRLSRNFGHQLALTAGMAVSTGGAVVTLDSDLQHPPEFISKLVETGRLGYDVVYAVRSSDDAETLRKRLPAKIFYKLLAQATSLDLPEGAADFRLMSRRVVDIIGAMPERHRFLRGMTRWAGFSQTFVTYERPIRADGASKYSFGKMMGLAWDAITSFSVAPLRIGAVVGAAVSLAGWVYLAYVIGIHVFTSSSVPGWTSLTAAVLALGGLQLVLLAIIAQYVARTYEETKQRPLFLISEDTRHTVATPPTIRVDS